MRVIVRYYLLLALIHTCRWFGRCLLTRNSYGVPLLPIFGGYQSLYVMFGFLVATNTHWNNIPTLLELLHTKVNALLSPPSNLGRGCPTVRHCCIIVYNQRVVR
jgi:hypothetical protein